MKKQFVSIVFASLTGLSLLLLAGLFQGMCWKRDLTPKREESTDSADSQFNPREQIVFILGEDELEGNPYYAQATKYFRFRESVKAENLVVHCRSLKEVRDYLVQEKNTENPWGQVHLVVHGNQWNGLSLPVYPDGERTTSSNIKRAIEAGLFPSFPEGVLDAQSELIFHACGTGRDEALMQSISGVFGGQVVVRSAKYFVSYDSQSGMPWSANQYLSEYWFTTYQTGRRPIDPILAEQLKADNPDANMDWMGALSRQKPRWPGDVYHYRFSVPVRWVVAFGAADQLPVLETETERAAFLQSQSELMEKLRKIGIPLERFSWKFEESTYTLSNGQEVPAILIEGKSSILCVLRAITEPEEKVPMAVDLTDERFYAVVGG
ncbi:MAG: hypothetical protein GYB31_12075 [Bacteroidetes bacterium]|nr:hypothetical protein [Bacteroidota bacterium]